MNEMSLENASISALLDISFNQRTFQPVIRFVALEQTLALHIVGLIDVSMSREIGDRFSDASNIVEVKTSRKVVRFHGHSNDSTNKNVASELEVHSISFFGDINMNITCSGFSVTYEPLAKHFPHIK